MSKAPTLSDRLSKARSGSAHEVTDRARRGLMAYVGAQADAIRASKELADGTAATGVGGFHTL